MADRLTIAPMAVKLGIQEDHLRKLAKRGLIPCGRAGRIFTFDEADAPAIREAARKAGYLPPEPTPAAACPA